MVIEIGATTGRLMPERHYHGRCAHGLQKAGVVLMDRADQVMRTGRAPARAWPAAGISR